MRNRAEPEVRSASPLGNNRGTDATDIPFGQWIRSMNAMVDPRNGYLRTRDGYMPVTDRLFSEPFAILEGANGGRTVTVPTVLEDPPYGEFALKLVASPNRDLHCNVSNPLTITFVTYGGSELGISSYDWDFSYDGVSFSTDESGASTSTTHDYTVPGTYKIIVKGTGDGSVVYTSSCTLKFLDVGDSDPVPTPLPTPPNEDDPDDDGSGDDDEDVIPSLTVSPESQTVEVDETAEIKWYTSNAQTVDVVKADGSTASLGTSGVLRVTPDTIGTHLYQFTAEAAGGLLTQTAIVTAVASGQGEDPTAGWLWFPDNTVQSGETFDIVVSCFEFEGFGAAEFPDADGDLDPDDPTLVVHDAQSSLTDNLSSVTITQSSDNTLATFADVTLTLPSGVTEQEVEIRAFVEGSDVTQHIGTITVFDPDTTFTVTVEESDGTDISETETILSDGQCTATIYLLITVQDATSSEVVTDYSDGAIINWDVTDGAPDPDEDSGSPTLSYPSYCEGSTWSDANAISITQSNVTNGTLRLPDGAFLNGAGYVVVKLNLSIPGTQDYSTAKYCDIDFVAREALSGE